MPKYWLAFCSSGCYYANHLSYWCYLLPLYSPQFPALMVLIVKVCNTTHLLWNHIKAQKFFSIFSFPSLAIAIVPVSLCVKCIMVNCDGKSVDIVYSERLDMQRRV